jgi:hypothetical protein
VEVVYRNVVGALRLMWVKIKVKITLEQAKKTQRGSRCITVLFL